MYAQAHDRRLGGVCLLSKLGREEREERDPSSAKLSRDF